MYWPTFIDQSSDGVYIVDRDNSQVIKIDNEDNITTVAGRYNEPVISNYIT